MKEYEIMFKCKSCKNNKNLSEYHKKPNNNNHYNICKDCNVKNTIKRYIIDKKTANHFNMTLDELKELYIDKNFDDENDVIDYAVNLKVEDEDIKNEGEILYELLQKILHKEDKHILFLY